MPRSYTLPPLMKNGNPLSAYGVNQIINSVNSLKSDYFDYNIMKQRTLMVNEFAAWECRYVLVHKFKNLKIIVQVDGANSMGDLKIYARKAGVNQTAYLIHTAAVTSAPQTLTIDLNMDTSLSGFTVSYDDIYLISFRNTYPDSGGVRCLYMYEYQDSAPVAPTISTLTSSTVVGDTYLNGIINAIRALPSSLNVNIPFNGVGSPGDYNASAYMQWLGRRRSRYVYWGIRTIDSEVTVDTKINGQIIHTFESTNVANTYYNFSYDLVTNPNSITVPAIGSDYTFSVDFEHVNEGHPSAACFVTYAYESDY